MTEQHAKFVKEQFSATLKRHIEIEKRKNASLKRQLDEEHERKRP